MILNRTYYSRISYFKSLWVQKQIKSYLGPKVFKVFRLFKTELPSKVYFYSPRLKRIPRFTGNIKLLEMWKESRICEIICPTSAIKVTGTDFKIDPQGCVACGLCLELAPPGVLEVPTELEL